MEQAVPATDNSAAPTVTSELPPAAVAAPADGVVATESQQPAEGEGEAPEQPSDQPPANKKPEHRQILPRISEVTRQRDAERAARLRLEGELEAYRRLGIQPPQPQAVHAEPVRDVDQAPDPNDYPGGEFDPRYQEDLIDWKVDQRLATREQTAQEKAAFVENKNRFLSVREETLRAAETSEFLTEAPAVLEFFGSNDLKVADAIAACESPADVAEYLGRENRIQQLGRMAPEQRTAWVAKVDTIITSVHAACQNSDYVAEYLRMGDNLRALAAMPLRDRMEEIRRIDKQIGINLASAAQPAPAPAPQDIPPANPPAPTGAINGRGATPSFDPTKARSFAEFEGYAQSVWASRIPGVGQ